MKSSNTTDVSISYIFKILILFLIIFTFENVAIAGGIWIHENSVIFDFELNKTTFSPNKRIDMDFDFDYFEYSGKPNSYGIFKIYKSNENENPIPIGYLSFLIESEHGHGRVSFILPEPNSSYEIKYHVSPYFSNEQLRTGIFGGYLGVEDIRGIIQFFDNPSNTDYTEHLVNINSRRIEPFDENKELAIYFVNPTKVKSDLDASKPLTFQWNIGAGPVQMAENIKYSYRLDPIEDWTIYSENKQATYNFLRKGHYSFWVRAKYTINGDEKESKIATFKVRVLEDIFGLSKKEILTKHVIEVSPEFHKAKHYNNSRALLIGVSKYDDISSYAPLSFAENDVKLLGNLLREMNFDVKIMANKTTKRTILDEFAKFLELSNEGDRVIIYYSGHGTSYGDLAYLVPSDGYAEDKNGTCIDFKYLSNWIEEMMEVKKVKHLLMILDSCQSGLGVLSKSERKAPIEVISQYTAAHMMTAGLGIQDAIINDYSGYSIFTEFLVNGLQGAADLTEDNIISLTELLVYVQDTVSTHVSNKYDREQTPMMGKIKGAGEMIFLLDK